MDYQQKENQENIIWLLFFSGISFLLAVFSLYTFKNERDAQIFFFILFMTVSIVCGGIAAYKLS